jgi:putative SOS response-associated peptidase YedK
MCYHTALTVQENDIERATSAVFLQKDIFTPKKEFNGFENPDYPIVRWDERNLVQYYEWGLLADYLTGFGYGKNSKEAKKARNNCLNARIEELQDKSSFKAKIGNRIIVPMNGMYEWQWADVNSPKCKKTKYLVTKPDQSLFFCAGLFNEWVDPMTRNITYCYTICTTVGNELMKEIKNEGQRMLVVLKPEEVEHWLDPKIHQMEFADRTDVELKAVLAEPLELRLF